MISIIVCSYNSEKTILETLKSIEKQSYKDFEVIITDDCSTDKTLQIIKNWKIKTKIAKVNVIVAKKNSGITKNLNRGIKACKGEWIKIIAADDILLEDCLQNNIDYVKNNSTTLILTSSAQYFNSEGIINKISPKVNDYNKFLISSKEQYKKLLETFYICSVTSFIKKEYFDKYGFYDEKIPFIEDYPFFLKATKLGVKIDFFPKVTVKYRIGESLSNAQQNLINLNFYNSKKLIYQYYLKNNCTFLLNLHYLYDFFIYDLGIKIFNNKKNKFSILFIKGLKILDFFIIKEKIKNIFYYKRKINGKQ